MFDTVKETEMRNIGLLFSEIMYLTLKITYLHCFLKWVPFSPHHDHPSEKDLEAQKHQQSHILPNKEPGVKQAYT